MVFSVYLQDMKCIKFLIPFLLLDSETLGQDTLEEMYARVSKQYYDSLSIEQEPLYIGEIDPLVIRSRTTHPFFQLRSWQEGSVEFGDAVYHNVSFLYNLETQRLTLRRMDPRAKGGVIVNLTDVKWFKVGANLFRKSPYDEQDRFLHVLFAGTRFNLLAFRRKSADTSPSGIIYTSKTDYFLEYKEGLWQLRNKSDLKKLFPNYKTINLAIKAENKKLKYTKFKEELMKEYMRVFDEKLVD